MTTTPNTFGPNLLARLLSARSAQQIDEYAKAAWVLNGEGLIPDREMEYLAPVIEHQRKSAGRPTGFASRSATGSAPRHRPAIPAASRGKAWLLRRAVAKDCVIPTCLAKLFTVSKLAVLAIIARAVIEKGASTMSLAEIAARAGVGCTTARYAIREAACMGLISVKANRYNAIWNRPNTIQIISPRWNEWLRVYRNSKAKRANGGSLTTTSDRPLRIMTPIIETNRFRWSDASTLVAPASALPLEFEPMSDPPTRS
ncbi:hypothetical protein EPK99_23595 [Neorhizobium lilium]|uniref:Helix-turn-helix domain-containing protein n=1 Tax=Neorhizobium lilium TaxID=2503024 RepID=A0A3S3S9R2_9HYPH|nr:hypothetical protein [Neorhizobium lilium]RWX74873.1 hypothetical protein EPK99_23595 [Neorhizobium lilium]